MKILTCPLPTRGNRVESWLIESEESQSIDVIRSRAYSGEWAHSPRLSLLIHFHLLPWLLDFDDFVVDGFDFGAGFGFGADFGADFGFEAALECFELWLLLLEFLDELVVFDFGGVVDFLAEAADWLFVEELLESVLDLVGVFDLLLLGVVGLACA